MDKVNKRLPELDILSGMAILCVILIHSNGYYLSYILKLQSYVEAGFIVRLLDNFIHVSVSLFIFIAGYKYALNNINDEYKKYATKKIKSVLKPFFVLSFVFFIYAFVIKAENLTSIKNVIMYFLDVFTGRENFAYQLWYVPMYLFISLTYPILYKVFRNEKIRLLIILFIVLGQELLGRRFELLSARPFYFVYYYLFFELGLIFYKYDVKNKIRKWDLQIIFMHVLLTLILTINPTSNVYSLIQYGLKYYILWPLCITAYYLISLRLINNKIFAYLGKYSFYIFLLHEPIICSKISSIFKNLGIYNSIIYVFVITIVTILCTMAVYKLIKRTFINNILFTINKQQKAVNNALENNSTYTVM